MTTNIDKTAQTIRLKDGRTLGFAEFGDLEGKPVFVYHGYPSCRMDGIHHSNQAEKLGIHLISPDRPGFGLSTIKLDRSFLDWSDDVIELANSLGIERFAVIGGSGGGPYAAASAYKMPSDRLVATGIVCGMGRFEIGMEGMLPQNAQIFTTIRDTPLEELSQRLRESFEKNFLHSVDEGLNQLQLMKDFLPEPDMKVLVNVKYFKTAIAYQNEPYRQGSFLGSAIEGKLYVKPWDFNLEDIDAKVYLFHGELDVHVPIRMARDIAKKIKNCKATFYPDEGHISILENRYTDIIMSVTITL